MKTNSIIYELYDAILSHPGTMVLRNGSDGCWHNSLVAGKLMCDRGLRPRRILIESKTDDGERGWFKPRMAAPLDYHKSINISWSYHTAGACNINGVLVVIDPFLFATPATLPEYRCVFPIGASCMITEMIEEPNMGPSGITLGEFVQRNLADARHISDTFPLLPGKKLKLIRGFNPSAGPVNTVS